MMYLFTTYNPLLKYFFFFFNDTATTEIYTLSLHDALPISFPETAGPSKDLSAQCSLAVPRANLKFQAWPAPELDRKSTRLNSSHSQISYAVFCLKKKKKQPDSSRSVTRAHLYATTYPHRN